MSQLKVRVVSRSTLKRLPLYLHLLESLADQGLQNVSCTQIAEKFDFDPTQVRKDLEATGEVGTARIGFRTVSLIVKIKEFLGWNNAHDAFLVGAGNMGKALLGYKDFDRYGLNIVAAFDKDTRKVGSRIFNREVLPLVKLPNLAKRMHINIGIVTVPAEYAQEVVDLMVVAGIKAIWNFAPAPLKIPEGVILENARLTQSLAVLTNNLTKVLGDDGKDLEKN
ncbi:MAG: redox-sensing transcriptional repressor Rex [Candidatus Omnitrophica bacterium]|nr:redox-sensing transcriptional repressor Rex [Candidatus Omnitrophota bacterium]